MAPWAETLQSSAPPSSGRVLRVGRRRLRPRAQAPAPRPSTHPRTPTRLHPAELRSPELQRRTWRRSVRWTRARSWPRAPTEGRGGTCHPGGLVPRRPQGAGARRRPGPVRVPHADPSRADDPRTASAPDPADGGRTRAGAGIRSLISKWMLPRSLTRGRAPKQEKVAAPTRSPGRTFEDARLRRCTRRRTSTHPVIRCSRPS